MDFDLLHFFQKKCKHPTTKSRIWIPLVNPKLTVEETSLLLEKDLPYLLAAEISVTSSFLINTFFTVKYELSLPPLLLNISKLSF